MMDPEREQEMADLLRGLARDLLESGETKLTVVLDDKLLAQIRLIPYEQEP